MKFEGEYIIKIKLNDIFMPSDHSSTELKDKIKQEGRKKINSYLTNSLFDPEKKIITEEINFKLKQI